MDRDTLTSSKKLDAFDWRILAALQQKGRLSYAALGRHVGVRLEADGVIVGYAVVINPKRFGSINSTSRTSENVGAAALAACEDGCMSVFESVFMAMIVEIAPSPMPPKRLAPSPGHQRRESIGGHGRCRGLRY